MVVYTISSGDLDMGGLNFFLLESRMGPDLGTEKLHLSYVKSAPSLIYLCCLMGVR